MKKCCSIFVAIIIVLTFLLSGCSEQQQVYEQIKGEEITLNYDSLESNSKVAIPDTLYAFVGEKITLYYLNLTYCNNLDDVKVTIDADGKGVSYTDRWEYVPAKKEKFDLVVTVSDVNGNVSEKKTCAIDVKDQSEKERLNVLLIGDSTINNGTISKTVFDKALANNYSLSLLGTRGNNYALHEGRSGWTAKMFVEREEDKEGFKNFFYNSETNSFDFAYYMDLNSYKKVDCVVIQLGINDVFSCKTDEVLDYSMQQYMSYMSNIINSIKQYDDNVKVVINLILPCSVDESKFLEAYGGEQTAGRCKQNSHTANLNIINNWGNKENEDIFIFYSNLTLDTNNNMDSGGNGGIHPSKSGYTQIGEQLYSFLRAIN